ncbi:hypothetical protein [Planomonospora venezuelensis]|uniref:Uncharacterized protein n=1 Tax=Planomonospora venezuelensis TaxID=1999 RepID=A0A841DLM1_PLAVE|nr:hypothetical protein [Planomonospora venezuelensis]MBB5968006.1 hypothetical protein [Planomonospora venezuelensis]
MLIDACGLRTPPAEVARKATDVVVTPLVQPPVTGTRGEATSAGRMFSRTSGLLTQALADVEDAWLTGAPMSCPCLTVTPVTRLISTCGLGRYGRRRSGLPSCRRSTRR